MNLENNQKLKEHIISLHKNYDYLNLNYGRKNEEGIWGIL